LALNWFRYAPRQFAGFGFWKAVGVARQVAYRFMPGQIRRHLANRPDNPYIPAKGEVQFGDFRRLTPFSREFGYDRGLPIDRYYIESFLAHHADDITGRVLEIGDDSYTRRFGGERVSIRDVLHVTEGNPAATIVADLAHADHIPSNSFDCIILTQTLHLVYDVNAALRTLQRILKPGGVLLTTFPGISQISIDEWSDCWYWAFTLHSAHRMFEEVFPPQNLEIHSFGNVLAATAFLQGLAVDELDRKELDHNDPHYQALITVRAIKPENG
jgi:SAM-dependent methyltransferase